MLSAGSIKKVELRTPVSSGIKLEKIVITNAADLKTTDFACWTNKDTLVATDLKFTPGDDSTLTLESTDGSAIDMTVFRDIHFGDSSKDINLCAPSSQFYKIKDGDTIDLTKSTATTTLTSLSGNPNLPDLTLTLTLLNNTDIVNVHWTFATPSDGEMPPFEVPVEIVQPNKDKVSDGALSDFVTYTQAEGAGLVLNILNGKAGTPFYTLNGFVLGKYINIIDGKAMAAKDTKFKGLLGLTERISNDLFLGTGVYSLWSRD